MLSDDRLLDAEAGDELVLDLDLRRDPGAGVVVEIGRNPADGEAMPVVWRGDRVVVAGQAHVVPGIGDHLDLRILVDRSLIEIFANGGRTVITRIGHGAVAALARGALVLNRVLSWIQDPRR